MVKASVFKFISLSFVLVFISCSYKDKEIRVYKTAKKKNIETQQQAVASPDAPVVWSLPKGWVENKSSQMRVGSFSAPAPKGYSPADVSVVVLGGDAGGVLANVNRWLEQIELPPTTELELMKNTHELADQRQWYELVNPKNGAAIYVSMFQLSGDTVFVKMVGQEKVLKSQKSSFEQLVSSIQSRKK